MLCELSSRRPFLETLIICESYYIDKWAWSIEALHPFMCIYMVSSTWARDYVALIPWNMTLHQIHFRWLFSSLSMRSSSQMNGIELMTLIFPKYDGFRLNRWWYFYSDLPGGSAMSKYCLINDEKNHWGIKMDRGDLSRELIINKTCG